MSQATPELAVQTVAYAGLDALLAVRSFDLCAYLHVGEQLGPQLYLRQPTLASLDPAAAFRLFSALRDQLDEAPTEDARLTIEDFDSIVVPSAGPHSRGLFVAGAKGEPLDEEDATIAGGLAQAVMGVCHLAETALIRHAPPTIRQVTVETRDGRAHATVALVHEGEERTGDGDDAAAVRAVAVATLSALDPSLKVEAADEDGIGDERAVLVLVRDAAGRVGVGASLVDGDTMSSAAEAALAAASTLAS